MLVVKILLFAFFSPAVAVGGFNALVRASSSSIALGNMAGLVALLVALLVAGLGVLLVALILMPRNRHY